MVVQLQLQIVVACSCSRVAWRPWSDPRTHGHRKSKWRRCTLPLLFLFFPHRTAQISFLPLTSPLLATPFRSRNHATSLTLKNKGSSDDLGSLSLSHSLFDSFVHCLACASFITCLLVFLFLLFCVLITSFSRPNHRSPPDGHCTYLQPLRAPGLGRLVMNLGLVYPGISRETGEPIINCARLRCSGAVC